MFLIYFLGFTLIFTVFENISLAGILFVLVVLFLVIYQMIGGKKIFTKKMMWSLVGGFVLAMVAWGVREYGYYSDIAFTIVYKSSTRRGGSPSFIKEDKMGSLV
jgi:hypothetical protein